MNFDRCASLRALHRPLDALATSPSLFESLPSDSIEKIKGSTCRHYLLFFGGEQGIRTLEAVLATYTISKCLPDTPGSLIK